MHFLRIYAKIIPYKLWYFYLTPWAHFDPTIVLFNYIPKFMLRFMYMTFHTLKDAYLLSKEPLQQQNSRKNWSKSASHMRIVNTNQSLRSCLFCFHNEYNSWSYFDCVNLMIKLKVCFCAGLVNFSLLIDIQ